MFEDRIGALFSKLNQTRAGQAATFILAQRAAESLAPNMMSLLRGDAPPALLNVPDTPGKVPPTDDPRGFGAVAEAASIGENFIPGPGPAKLGGSMLAGLMGLGARKGIRAYHGSPHDFDKFDLSKIGTGEGAQAYGHGLYFAENPAVAESYKGGIFPQNAVGNAAKRYLDQFGNLDEAVAYATARRSAERAKDNKQFWTDVVERMHSASKTGEFGPRGRMYEVDINAKPEQFLDWDRRMGQQPADVQAVASAVRKFDPERSADAWYMDVGLGRKGSYPEATDTLRQAGIPGIKYLDQGSRGAEPAWTVGGKPLDMSDPTHVAAFNKALYPRAASQSIGDLYSKGDPVGDEALRLLATKATLPEVKDVTPRSSNYVVFDDSLIDILRKYGLSGLMATGVLGATLPEQTPAQ
jgi:hypothetical protein